MLISDFSNPPFLLLDTHIWVWASDSGDGRKRFASWLVPEIEQAGHSRRLLVSVASVWEIALKARRVAPLVTGELGSWVEGQKRYPGVRVLPITSAVAIESTQLPSWLRSKEGKEHKDPNDRFLVATARIQAAVLITCDELILQYAASGHLMASDARP